MEELLDQLYDAHEFLRIRNGYKDLENSLEEENTALEKQYRLVKSKKPITFHIWLITFYIVTVTIMMGSLIATQTKSHIPPVICLAVAVVSIVFAAKRTKTKKQKPAKEAEKYMAEVAAPRISENEEKIKKINDELVDFTSENKQFVSFLPVDYRYDIDAVSYMIYTIENEMASSIKEAMKLYIEQLHRWKMEEAVQGMARSAERHHREMEEYMADIRAQQEEANSRLANIETLTFLDYLDR